MKNLLAHFSFSQRIILAMLMVVVFTSVSVILIVFIQFSEESKTYHDERLERKAERVLQSIDYELDYNDSLVTAETLEKILANRIYGIAHVNEQDIVLYSLQGKYLISTHLGDEEVLKNLGQPILDSLEKNEDFRSPMIEIGDQVRYYAYKYIRNSTNQKVGIVGLLYVSDNSFFRHEQEVFLQRYGWAMLFVLIMSVVLAYILSKQITYPLKAVAQKLKETEMIGLNKPLIYRGNDEVALLVNAYNDMLLKLKKQSELLAKEERDHAWREMARQVAHEVKNPLTPMQLMVQNFKHRFKPESEENKLKIDQLCNSILQQINDIRSIAEAFSDFAKMPIRQDEKLIAEDVIQGVLDIFPKEYVDFKNRAGSVKLKMDKSYLSRIVINLVKNSFQAIPEDRKPSIKIHMETKDQYVILRFLDNGTGVNQELKNRIFEPQFTTKSGGMGLGLAMVKKIVEDYGGTIEHQNREPHGAQFTIRLPYHG